MTRFEQALKNSDLGCPRFWAGNLKFCGKFKILREIKNFAGNLKFCGKLKILREI